MARLLVRGQNLASLYTAKGDNEKAEAMQMLVQAAQQCAADPGLVG